MALTGDSNNSITMKESTDSVDQPKATSKAAEVADLPTEESPSSSLQQSSSLLLPAHFTSQGISIDDVATAVRVLNVVAAIHPSKKKQNGKKRMHVECNGQHDDTKTTDTTSTKRDTNPLDEYKQCQPLRPFRKALAQCVQLHQQSLYNGQSKSDFIAGRIEEQTLKRQKLAESQLQRQHIANTQLRKGRIERLQQKQNEGKEEEEHKLQLRALQLMIPDGHVETTIHDNGLPQLLANGSAETKLLENASTDDQSDNAANQTDQDTTQAAAPLDDDPIQLPKLRSCYVCKGRFRQLHHFYDQLCPDCASLNWHKRHQSCNLQGKTAVVTGSRVKIGYQTCLKLLRAGCTVVATTRFPNAAADTYRKEPDFDQWRDRLQIIGLDLRDVTGLEAFCRFLKTKLHDRGGLDILINNACQTIRRPTAYYLPACEKEQELWQEGDATHQQLLAICREFETIRRQLLLEHKQQVDGASLSDLSPAAVPKLKADSTGAQQDDAAQGAGSATMITVSEIDEDDNKMAAKSKVSASSTPFESTGLTHSAASSQMRLVPEDVGVSETVLPKGATDINGQQLDLRTSNSWLLKMDEVSTPEVMECMFINAIAPFVLNSRLKPLMCTPTNHDNRYIVNVSAMEGKFYRYKMANHPHTNMAKSALNMMTRTSAEDLAKNHQIYMNSIDTGWINDENPLERAHQTAKNNHFQTPIDEIDAAARIVDPIFSASKDYGKFLKDYRETEW